MTKAAREVLEMAHDDDVDYETFLVAYRQLDKEETMQIAACLGHPWPHRAWPTGEEGSHDGGSAKSLGNVP